MCDMHACAHEHRQQAEPRTSLSNRLQGALGAGGAIGIATIEDFLEVSVRICMYTYAYAHPYMYIQARSYTNPNPSPSTANRRSWETRL